jgi:hypothetical protein
MDKMNELISGMIIVILMIGFAIMITAYQDYKEKKKK